MTDDLLIEALQTFGKLPQISKANEELNELAAELARYINGYNNDQALVEEIADVRIMLEQLELIFGPETVAEAEAEKRDRLRELLDEMPSAE